MFFAVHRTKPRVELEKSKVIVFGEHILVFFGRSISVGVGVWMHIEKNSRGLCLCLYVYVRVLACVCWCAYLFPFWPSACFRLFAATSGLNLMIRSMLAYRFC